jgi:PspAB-like protein
LGLRDVLFGRKQLKDAAGERLFAISTARITLETELNLKPAGAAGVCFKALSAGEFVRAENELQELLDSVATESGSKVERKSDEFGFEWIVVRDADFEDLVTSIHLVASELQARGFGPQLLAAVFPFEQRAFDGGRVFWIYGFKRGAFWPFVPKGEGKERDNAEELELKAKLEKELPIEEDLSRWFAVFDAPL